MEPTGTALGAQDLSIGYPARGRKGGRLYGALSLALRSGELTCLLGPNGAGKSTMLKVLVGEQPPTSGGVSRNGECTIGYMPQQMKVADTTTLYAETESAFAEVLDLEKEIDRLTALGFGNLPVCMAKTQYSFSDDAAKLGAPEHFTVTIRNVKVSAGAGFIVALTGDIMTMPGLPKVPAAERIDVDENGVITGLF